MDAAPEMSESPAPEEPPRDGSGQADPEPVPAQPSPEPPQPEPRDGNGATVLPPDGVPVSGDTERQDATDAREESFDHDDLASRQTRLDFPKVKRLRDAAGRDINYYFGQPQEKRTPGRISVTDLARISRVHVTTQSDGILRERLGDDPMIFMRGGIGTGRKASAIAVLDRLTGTSRNVSRVSVVEVASGLAGLAGQLESGRGHLLDASGEDWIDTITDAQLASTRQALGAAGFLIILVEADGTRSFPGAVVDHEIPDLAQVVVFHLAARFTEDGPLDTAGARALIDEACAIDTATDLWHKEITSAATSRPVDAVSLADAIWDWRERRSVSAAAKPMINDFRDQLRYRQAADLLRRGPGMDSPLRQSYAISAAVLDGLAVSEVVEGAGTLSTLLAEVEHPGSPGHREIFAQPLARWLRHVEMAAPSAEPGSRDGAVVRMPSRELSRIVIEIAWQNYDAARQPMLVWLTSLCRDHPNDRVRIRAAQALAVIGQHDYSLIKNRVLEMWSRSDRRIEHQAAAWLMEAMVAEGTVAEKVKDLLRRWSRSGDRRKRAVAVRAYGTSVARFCPDDAIRGVRFSAPDPWLGALPELALCEMYTLGLSREVTAELLLWMRGFPLMRERAGRSLMRIAAIRRLSSSESGPYDLLWRLACAPDEVELTLPAVAALWHLACTHENSRSYAWQMLGRWAESCSKHPELRNAFTQLADEFARAADSDALHARLAVYRRRWAEYLKGDLK
jgi:hypothetical protein